MRVRFPVSSGTAPERPFRMRMRPPRMREVENFTKSLRTVKGYYIFPQLFVGKYSVTVEQTGFKTFVQKGITIDAQSKLTIDVTLTLGSLNERIEVEASSAQVQTDSAKVGATIENKQIQNL